jgi:hypothetical protein
MTSLELARRLALALPEATEEPHFDMSSFRVRGKIFATAPPDGGHLHVFLDEDDAATWAAEDPAAFELLHWGKSVRGLRVRLAAASEGQLRELLTDSWRRRAPKKLAAGLDPASPGA